MGWACFKSYVSGPEILKADRQVGTRRRQAPGQPTTRASRPRVPPITGSTTPPLTTFSLRTCNQARQRRRTCTSCARLRRRVSYPPSGHFAIGGASFPCAKSKMEGMLQETTEFHNVVDDYLALTDESSSTRGYWPTAGTAIDRAKQLLTRGARDVQAGAF